MKKIISFLYSSIVFVLKATVFSQFFIWFLLPLIKDPTVMNIPIAYGILVLVQFLIPLHVVQTALRRTEPKFENLSSNEWSSLWLGSLLGVWGFGSIMHSFI